MLGLMTAASSDLLGRDATLRLARVIGEATAKIGDAVVGAFRAQIEAPSRVAGDPYADTVTTYADLVSGSLPPLQEAVGACVRRHVIQAAAGSWTLTPGEAQPRRDLVVGFVDLAGWTALSRIADDVALARAVERFEGLVSNAATEHDIRVVKFLGDGAMVVAEAADAVCRFANAVISTVAADDVLPPARVGLAAGSVLPSGGDYHGPTVNLAARLAAVAPPSSALADEETQRRASDVTFGPLRVYELRGITEPMRAAIVAA
jgi:adenylate cyclase